MAAAVDTDCCLCLQVLTEPVVTPCGHIFDRRCLRRVMITANTNDGEDAVLCPKCRAPLPANGAGLAVCIPLQQLIAAARPDEVAARTDELNRSRDLGSAAYRGDVRTVKRLLAIPGIDVNEEGWDRGKAVPPPLRLAIRKGHRDTVRLLLDARADVSSTLPVLDAIQSENLAMLELLLQHRAATVPQFLSNDDDDTDDDEDEDEDGWPSNERVPVRRRTPVMAAQPHQHSG